MRVCKPEEPLSRLDSERLDPLDDLDETLLSRGVFPPVGVLLEGVARPEELGVLETDVGFEPNAAPWSKLSEL
jgi:hypothetical protein